MVAMAMVQAQNVKTRVGSFLKEVELSNILYSYFYLINESGILNLASKFAKRKNAADLFPAKPWCSAYGKISKIAVFCTCHIIVTFSHLCGKDKEQTKDLAQKILREKFCEKKLTKTPRQ
jgi:hypothetical protein